MNFLLVQNCVDQVEKKWRDRVKGLEEDGGVDLIKQARALVCVYGDEIFMMESYVVEEVIRIDEFNFWIPLHKEEVVSW